MTGKERRLSLVEKVKKNGPEYSKSPQEDEKASVKNKKSMSQKPGLFRLTPTKIFTGILISTLAAADFWIYHNPDRVSELIPFTLHLRSAPDNALNQPQNIPEVFRDENTARRYIYRTVIQDEPSRQILLREIPSLEQRLNTKNNRIGRANIRNIEVAKNVRDYFTRDWLEDDLYSRFQETPVMVLVEDHPFYSVFSEQGIYANAFYKSGTNIIVVSAPVYYMLMPVREYTIRLQIHEHLHLLAWLGSSVPCEKRWDRQAPLVQRGFTALHEGFTEMFTNKIAAEQGFRHRFPNYPVEATVATYIYYLAGGDDEDQILKRAYFSGDGSELRSKLDVVLGEGAFDRITKLSTGEGMYRELMAKMKMKNIDSHQWDHSDSLLKTIGRLEIDL